MTTLGMVAALAPAVALAVALVAARRRVSDLRRRLAEADRAAHTDPLTGLANRAGLRRLIDELAIPDAAGHHVAAIALDLDGLKSINDHHGHHVGDEVLAEVARVAIGRPRVTEQPPITITASVGFAVMPTEHIDELLTAADLAMYRMKSAGTGIHSNPASWREHAVPLPRHRMREPARTDQPNRTRRNGHATTISSSTSDSATSVTSVTVPARGLRPTQHRQRLVS